MYYVFGSDGGKTGPFSSADIAKFLTDGRLSPQTEIENADTGERVIAGDVRQSGPPPTQPEPPLQPTFQAHQEQRYEQPPMAPKKSNAALIVVGVVVVLLCGCFSIFGAVLFPVFSQAKKSARVTQGISNMKQVATGVIIYCADYDDRFPTDMGDPYALETQIAPYVRNRSVFFAYRQRIQSNPKLAGVESTKLKDETKTIMLWVFAPELGDEAVATTADTHTFKLDKNTLQLAISSGKYEYSGD